MRHAALALRRRVRTRARCRWRSRHALVAKTSSRVDQGGRQGMGGAMKLALAARGRLGKITTATRKIEDQRSEGKIMPTEKGNGKAE